MKCAISLQEFGDMWSEACFREFKKIITKNKGVCVVEVKKIRLDIVPEKNKDTYIFTLDKNVEMNRSIFEDLFINSNSLFSRNNIGEFKKVV